MRFGMPAATIDSSVLPAQGAAQLFIRFDISCKIGGDEIACRVETAFIQAINWTCDATERAANTRHTTADLRKRAHG